MSVTKCYKKKTGMSQDWEGSVEIVRGKAFVWDPQSVISAIAFAVLAHGGTVDIDMLA